MKLQYFKRRFLYDRPTLVDPAADSGRGGDFPPEAIVEEVEEFLKASTGVEVSVEDIERTVTEIFEEHKDAVLEQHYRTNGWSFFFAILIASCPLMGSTYFDRCEWKGNTFGCWLHGSSCS
ncbi:hypothetical protein Vadar_013921 [Vaccinium darrowii]|uniref:Uncharacterized protein n=1 Tax=Vaccinium darrowii TaxID=229202 RepID=A0ACB7ZK41_9ERIC|nr:hypothetical protein Vadar_013921 [Vaccinium darrowii]